MQGIILTILLSYVASISCFSLAPEVLLSIRNYALMQSRQAPNSQYQKTCFDTFYQLYTEEYETWITGYVDCELAASAEYNSTQDAMRSQQEQLNIESGLIQKNITECQELNYPEDAFICYSALNSQIESIVSISNNAKDNTVIIQRTNGIIEEKLKACTTKADREYDRNMVQLRKDQDDCLKNGPPSTTSTTETTSTTIASSTTTEDNAE